MTRCDMIGFWGVVTVVLSSVAVRCVGEERVAQLGASSRSLALPGAVSLTGGRVAGVPVDASRYFSVLELAGGLVVVFARSGEWPNAFPGTTSTAWIGSSRSDLLSGRWETVVSDPNVSHNLGVSAVGGSLYAAGGQENLEMSEGDRGIRVYEFSAEAVSSARGWVETARIRGGHGGCVERRRIPHKCAPGVCEFDGRLSLASANGYLYLYARANLRQRNGGRYVQVARRRLRGGPWGAFAPLDVDGFRWQDAFDMNVYYAAVNANPVDPSTLLALAPVNTGKRAYVGLALSCDGARFSRLEPVVASAVAPYGRSPDHPVDGFLVEGDLVHVYVHHNVPGIAPDGARPAILRFSIPAPSLRNYTANAVRALRKRRACHPRVEWPPPPPPAPDWLWCAPKCGDWQSTAR